MSSADRLAHERVQIARIRDLLHTAITASAIQPLIEAWPDWDGELQDLVTPRDDNLNVSVALIGGMGTGKSTLINALLGAEVLPTSAYKACTSTVCEVGYQAIDYSAVVEFLRREEWEAEFAWLRQEPQAPEDPVGDTTTAWQRLRTVYRLGEDADRRFLAGGLPSEPEEIRRSFDSGRLAISAKTPEQLRDAVGRYLTSEGHFWPIVRAVRLRGPFDVLSTGVTLADLPGVNDPNQAREQVTLDYLDHSRFLWIVFPCRRPPTRDLFDVLEGKNLFRDLFIEGRLGEVAFVATSADDLNRRTARKEFGLGQDAALEAVLSERKRRLADGVLAAVHDAVEYQASRSQEQGAGARARIAAPPVFAVSAQDYLEMRLGGDPRLMESLEQTEIPQLQEYLKALGSSHGVEHHVEVLRAQAALILEKVEAALQGEDVRCRQQQELTNQQRQEVRAAGDAATGFLDGELAGCLLAYNQAMSSSRDLLAERFKGAVRKGQGEVDRIVGRWAAIDYRTLRPVCLNGGRHSTGKGTFDLAGDLVDPLLDAVAFAWEEFFGDQLGRITRTGYERLEKAAHEFSLRFREEVSGRLREGSSLRQPLQRLLGTTQKLLKEQMAQATDRIDECISQARSTLNGRVPGRVRTAMKPAIAGAAQESGTGSHDRRVNHHLRPAAKRIAQDVFTEIQQDIQAEVRGLQDRLGRDYGELTKSVSQNARRVVENLCQSLPELSTQRTEKELQALAKVAAAVRGLRAR